MEHIAFEGSDLHVVSLTSKGHGCSFVRVELPPKTTDYHGGPNKGRTSATKTSTNNQRSNWRGYGKAALKCLGILAKATVMAGAAVLLGAGLLVLGTPVAVAVVAVVVVEVVFAVNVCGATT